MMAGKDMDGIPIVSFIRSRFECLLLCVYHKGKGHEIMLCRIWFAILIFFQQSLIYFNLIIQELLKEAVLWV